MHLVWLSRAGSLDKLKTGHSAVRLAHLVWDQGAAGSNPAAPTINRPQAKAWGFVFYSRAKPSLREDRKHKTKRMK